MIRGKGGFLLFLFSLVLTGISCQVNSETEMGESVNDFQDKEVLKHITSSKLGKEGESSVEVLAYDKETKRIFVINSIANQLAIVNISNPENPELIKEIPMSGLVGGINSVATQNGIVAIAAENFDPQKNGWILFLDTDGAFINKVKVGTMPDMLKFSPDGSMLLSANEGEPDKNYQIDPEGSVSVVSLNKPVQKLTDEDVTSIGFTEWNDQIDELREKGVRIYGPNASVAQDLEPEYVAISKDSKQAFVTLQENNAIATIDLEAKKVTDIKSLGFKDFSVCGMDASDKSDKVEIASCPVKGLYQPDAIASFQVNGKTYLITANEGESREYPGYCEEVRAGDLNYFNGESYSEAFAKLKRLKVTKVEGDADGDGVYEEIVCFGGRSFSIWSDSIDLVYDSGNLFEKLTSEHPASKDFFNSSHNSEKPKKRSDDKGPEPEGVTTAEVNGRILAFITLERVGGVMVFDVTSPENAEYLQYINNRIGNYEKSDLGPETVLFIPSENSPDGKPLLLVANEVSSTIGVYRVNENFN